MRAEEVELRSADFILLHRFNLRDRGGFHREDPFDTDTTRNLADGDRAALGVFAFDSDHCALENLDALAFLTLGVGFFDLLVHANDHARFDLLHFRYLDDNLLCFRFRSGRFSAGGFVCILRFFSHNDSVLTKEATTCSTERPSV